MVVFDLGRVLIRIHDSWMQASTAVGVDITPEQQTQMAAQHEMLSKLNHRHECGLLSCEAFADEVSRLTGMASEHVLAGLDAWIIEPYESSRQLLADLRAAGVRTACLSNTNATHWRCMTDPGHPKYVGTGEMAHAFASHELGLRKPDAAIYEAVEQAMGVEPGGIVFFDDLEDNVQAARSRGWQAIQIDRSMDPGPQMRKHLERLGVLQGQDE